MVRESLALLESSVGADAGAARVYNVNIVVFIIIYTHNSPSSSVVNDKEVPNGPIPTLVEADTKVK